MFTMLSREPLGLEINTDAGTDLAAATPYKFSLTFRARITHSCNGDASAHDPTPRAKLSLIKN